MKLLVRAPMREEDLAALSTLFDEIVFDPWNTTGRRWYEDELLAELLRQQPDALITELDEVQEKVLAGYGRLQWVGDCRATPENIDVAACSRYGVPLLCTPGRNAQAVAEMWLALVIGAMRNISPAIRWMKDGGWVKGTTPYHLWMGNELMYKRVAFVGMGAVPQHIARLLRPFECDITYFDPFVEQTDFPSVKRESIESLFEDADIISLHLPLNEQTRGMITETMLSHIAPHALFVNTARAGVVDCDALYRLLKEKTIRGAVIDVFENEPPEASDRRFFELENCLVTPHICGSTYEIADHQSRILTDRILRFARGERGRAVVYNAKGLEERA
ncbi:MAG: NAD(P)-dependent oxidoreductase [Ndongobacter sp.]|nr:NAD(P)-dependent oxidoreductase [Ndongobacter sp.]